MDQGGASLPVIDYSEQDRDKQAGKILEVMETLGFLFLDKIPGYDEDELRWCQEFFFDVMPPEKKMDLARKMYNPKSNQVCNYTLCKSSWKAM